MIAADARVFALGNSQLTGPHKAARFLEHQAAIFRRAARESAPYVVNVTGHGLV